MIVKYNYKLGFFTTTHIFNKKLSCRKKNRKIRNEKFLRISKYAIIDTVIIAMKNILI